MIFIPHAQPPALGVLGNLAFPLLLIGALIFLARRNSNMPGGPGQAMQFGKQSPLLMEAETGVMFDDVAGVTEAKQELQEVVTFLKQPERFTSVGAQIPRGLRCRASIPAKPSAKAIAGEGAFPSSPSLVLNLLKCLLASVPAGSVTCSRKQRKQPLLDLRRRN